MGVMDIRQKAELVRSVALLVVEVLKRCQGDERLEQLCHEALNGIQPVAEDVVKANAIINDIKKIGE